MIDNNNTRCYIIIKGGDYMIEQLTQLISSVGFPITMCVYFMVSMNNTMKEVKETNNKLIDKLEILINMKEGVTHD